LQVLVRDNNVDQALRVLKKKMQREGVFREMKARKDYEKPSERKAREKAEAVCRARKQARKTAIREGLIAAPKPKPRFGGGPRRPGMSSGSGLRPQTCSGVGFSTDEKPAPEEQSERGREGY
jgi:small subunit ribosomal protein S21